MLMASSFSFNLPQAQIAMRPTEQRSHSRLLCLHRQSAVSELSHCIFHQLPDLLEPGDLLVFNDSRVIPARLLGVKATGGKVELLIERITGPHQGLAHIRGSKGLKHNTRLTIEGDWCLEVGERVGDCFQVWFPPQQSPLAWLEAHGHMPLPPYIQRPDDAVDGHRYQTVYSRYEGSVAAPTAGLHFDNALLAALEERGIEKAFLTLHVGAGTFQPVRCDDIKAHKMHSEWVSLDNSVVQQIHNTKARGGRVIAVGTTAVRSLETAALSGVLQPYEGETDIFIYPGFQFHCIDGMVTNFHLPKSTLLMLVSAFAGRKTVLAAYEEAVREGYRFFSYGDAMLLL